MRGGGDNRRAGDPLRGERGTILTQAPCRVALGYPARYGVAVSSLGFQSIYRALNELPGVACRRFFSPEPGDDRRPLLTVEDGAPVADSNAVALSLACERELYDAIELLEAADIPPLAERRDLRWPPVVIGGPLTRLDPGLVAPLADVAVVEDAEPSLSFVFGTLRDRVDRRSFLEALAAAGPVPGLWLPAAGASPPAPAHAAVEMLPARAATWSDRAELGGMFLIEAARGCPRGCRFCVMSAVADGSGPFRPVPVDRILADIPREALAVGLVGAAVTDHPEIGEIVERLVEGGRRVALSSVRADRLDEPLARCLRRGGLRTVTLAADGSSQRLRRFLRKGLDSDDLLRAAEAVAAAGIPSVKLYAMLGLPGEEDEDVLELAELVRRFPAGVRIGLAAQAFVPKPRTPLAAERIADPRTVRRRLSLLARALRGRARLLPTSPRWSWLDWKLAHAGRRAVSIALRARELNGTHAAWRRAVDEVLGA